MIERDPQDVQAEEHLRENAESDLGGSEYGEADDVRTEERPDRP